MGDTKQLPIRPLTTIQEMRQAVELQKIYWGEDGESVIPSHMLFSIVDNGGHVLAAMDGNTLAGFVVGMLGSDNAPIEQHLYVYSKRMIVNPDYRNGGLGYRLKMAQRDAAIQMGVNRVVWTFDPLLVPNAHLNLRKLGGSSRRYLLDHYGTDNTGGLSPHGMSDRLLVEWFVQQDAIQQRADSTFVPMTFDAYMAQNVPILAWADDTLPDHETAQVLVEVPVTQPDDIVKTMIRLRERFTAWMDKGYVVVDFVQQQTTKQHRAFYVLQAGVNFL